MNSALILNGHKLASRREGALLDKISSLSPLAEAPQLAAVVFREDTGSMLYTELKEAAATRLGFGYQVRDFSLTEPTDQIVAAVRELAADPAITGIIIQKPRRQTWQEANRIEGEPKDVRQAYQLWWQLLTGSLPIEKDVDGLHPSMISALEGGTYLEEGRVLPATVKAVLIALEEAGRALNWSTQTNATYIEMLREQRVAIVGRSDLLGKPLEALFKGQDLAVELFGVAGLERARAQGKSLKDFQVVISATGVEQLIGAADVSAGVVAIDVGEPRPDLNFAETATKAAYITPVPGGIGPLTVISLMENGFDLWRKHATITN